MGLVEVILRVSLEVILHHLLRHWVPRFFDFFFQGLWPRFVGPEHRVGGSHVEQALGEVVRFATTDTASETCGHKGGERDYGPFVPLPCALSETIWSGRPCTRAIGSKNCSYTVTGSLSTSATRLTALRVHPSTAAAMTDVDVILLNEFYRPGRCATSRSSRAHSTHLA